MIFRKILGAMAFRLDCFDGAGPMSHIYDNSFYDWVNMTALRSARRLIPLVAANADIRSVADVGCGQGAWLSVWAENGVGDLHGFDGAYVDRDRLLFKGAFSPSDLTGHFEAERRFDLVQSLEVAEHLPPECAQSFVERLCALSDLVMFSAARPGQGGEMHINERPPSFWAQLFKERGYTAYDFVRPAFVHDSEVDPWYRYNTVVYASETGATRLSQKALASRREDLAQLDGGGDLAWKLRLALLAPLPVSVVTTLSRWRYSAVCALQRKAGS
ncbi:MAG TPA: methyltransferase domain-containing protein [Beijerinckiaceae bacterium]|nr:methyltransferase domain-containing protein [Beijerinckiaceae bacterium]